MLVVAGKDVLNFYLKEYNISLRANHHYDHSNHRHIRWTNYIYIMLCHVVRYYHTRRYIYAHLPLSYNLSENKHTDRTLAGCARLLYGLKIPRAH